MTIRTDGRHHVDVILTIDFHGGLRSQTPHRRPRLERIIASRRFQRHGIEQVVHTAADTRVIEHEHIDGRPLATSQNRRHKRRAFVVHLAHFHLQRIDPAVAPVADIVPFIEDGFRLVVSMLVQQGAHAHSLFRYRFGHNGINVP